MRPWTIVMWIGAASALFNSWPAPARAAAVESEGFRKRPAPVARLDGDGMLVVGGRRAFVFGCYWNPATSQGLAALKQAGFNLVSAKAERRALDEAASHGLLAWIPLGERVAPSSEAGEKALEAAVAPLLDHRALVAWEVPDEALWNEWYERQGKLDAERARLRDRLKEREKTGADVSRVRQLMSEEAALRARADFAAAEARERDIRTWLGAPPQDPNIQLSSASVSAEQHRLRLLRGYRTLHRLDARPVWMNFAPRNTLGDIHRYAEAADVVGGDIYPVPVAPQQGHSDLANRQLSCVGDYAERFHWAAGNRAVWMVLQGFGWRDLNKPAADAPKDTGRRPTRAESRFMLYDAIVHRARGVLYWGCNYAQEPPEFWDELCSVVREAADQSDVWAARDAREQPIVSYEPTWGSVDRPPVALAKFDGNRTYVLIVNEHSDGLAVRLSGLGNLDGAKVSPVGAPGGCALANNRIANGSIIVHMPALSSCVIATGG